MGQAAIAHEPKPAFRAHPANHRFFEVMSILCAGVTLTGFASKYLPRVTTRELPRIIHVHAAIFTSWLLLFVIQAFLAGRGRIDLHRRLGVAGAALAAAMLVVGAQTAITVARMGHRGLPGAEFADPPAFLLLNLAAVLIFSVLVAAGVALRRHPHAHKRLMLLATVNLMPPGIARLPGIGAHLPAVAVVVLAFVLAGPIYDFVTRRRVHRAYLWGALLILGPAPPAMAALAATAGWHQIASWLI